jgi:hypothetical protein
MGRPEKPIPDDAPAKPLAEFLRGLRQRAGAPSYRQLSALVFCTHNALSQTVDGRYVDWPRIERFLDGLTRFQAGCVSVDDLKQARCLHSQARETREASRQGDTRRRCSNEVAQHWRRFDDECRFSARAVAATRAPGQWHTTDAAPPQLQRVTTPIELVKVLNGIVFVDAYPVVDLNDEAIRGVLAGRKLPSWELVKQLVTQCGGTDGDLLAWEEAWKRIDIPYWSRYGSYYYSPQVWEPDPAPPGPSPELHLNTPAYYGPTPGIRDLWRRYTKRFRRTGPRKRLR